MAGNSLQPMQLGGIQLQFWQVPEQLAKLFGVQKYAVHDFPGGKRTIYNLGSFPFSEIEWTGSLFDGDIPGRSAMDAATQFNALRMAAQPIALSYGQFNVPCFLQEFEVTARLPQWLEYRIKIIPTQDKTTSSNAAGTQPTADASFNNANNNFQTNATAPTSGASFPPAITNQVNTINNQVASAYQDANYQVNNILPATVASIQGNITTLQASLDPYVNGNDFQLATAASNLSAAAGNLSQTVNVNNTGPFQQIQFSNPNLMLAAGQFYGDPSLWPVLAAANGNPSDFILPGNLTLVVPPVSNTSTQ